MNQNAMNLEYGSSKASEQAAGVNIDRDVITSVIATLALAILLCGIYPVVVWGVAQVVFNQKANGSIIHDKDNKPRGSYLLGQSFAKPEYFHPRPSAAGSGYAADASSGTNLGPTSARLIEGIPDNPETKDVDESFAGMKQLAEKYRKENDLSANVPIPGDAITRSASGMDPHISVTNAQLQAPRVAKARNIDVDEVKRLIDANTDGRDLGFLGEPGVNVVKLNLALDGGGK